MHYAHCALLVFTLNAHLRICLRLETHNHGLCYLAFNQYDGSIHVYQVIDFCIQCSLIFGLRVNVLYINLRLTKLFFVTRLTRGVVATPYELENMRHAYLVP